MSAGLTCRRCSEPMASDEEYCQSCILWTQDTLCDCGSGASLADCSPEYGGGSTVTAIYCDADGVATTYYSDREPVIERPSAPPLSFEERQVVRRFDEAPHGCCDLCDGVGEVQARLPHVLTWDRISYPECMPAVER